MRVVREEASASASSESDWERVRLKVAGRESLKSAWKCVRGRVAVRVRVLLA